LLERPFFWKYFRLFCLASSSRYPGGVLKKWIGEMQQQEAGPDRNELPPAKLGF